jgi:hypothetical protein
MWDAIYPYLAAILPTIGLLVIAYVVFKTIFEADRRERKAVAEWETSHDGPQIGSSEDETRPTS